MQARSKTGLYQSANNTASGTTRTVRNQQMNFMEAPLVCRFQTHTNGIDEGIERVAARVPHL